MVLVLLGMVVLSVLTARNLQQSLKENVEISVILGDTVSVRNHYGITGTAVVTAVDEAEDETGYKLVPTLSDWKG